MEEKRFPSVTDSMERAVKDLREGFQNLPHVKVGEQKQPPQQVPQQPVQQQNPNQPMQNPHYPQYQQPIQQPQQPVPQYQQPIQQPIHPYNPVTNIPRSNPDTGMERFRKWMFWTLTILVGVTALILIVSRVVLRFFG